MTAEGKSADDLSFGPERPAILCHLSKARARALTSTSHAYRTYVNLGRGAYFVAVNNSNSVLREADDIW